jgi:hypothetical protein
VLFQLILTLTRSALLQNQIFLNIFFLKNLLIIRVPDTFIYFNFVDPSQIFLLKTPPRIFFSCLPVIKLLYCLIVVLFLFNLILRMNNKLPLFITLINNKHCKHMFVNIQTGLLIMIIEKLPN